MIDLTGFQKYAYKETISSGTIGESLYVHFDKVLVAGMRKRYSVVPYITMRVIPSGGATGRIEATLSPKEEIEAGTAVWENWASGNVTSITTDGLTFPVTGLRGVSQTGTIDIEVVF